MTHVLIIIGGDTEVDVNQWYTGDSGCNSDQIKWPACLANLHTGWYAPSPSSSHLKNRLAPHTSKLCINTPNNWYTTTASSPSELIRLSGIVSVVDKRKGRRIERELVRTKPVTGGHLLCSYLRDNLWDWKIKEGHDQHVLVLTAYGSHQVALSPANYHTPQCTYCYCREKLL